MSHVHLYRLVEKMLYYRCDEILFRLRSMHYPPELFRSILPLQSHCLAPWYPYWKLYPTQHRS